MNTGIDGIQNHALEHHPNFIFNENGKSLSVIEKVFFCPINQKWYGSRKWLARALSGLGITNETYYNEYGERFMPEVWLENTTDPVLGDARNTKTCLQCQAATSFDTGHWCYNAFCSFKCSTKWYAQNTDRPQRAMATVAQRQISDPTLNLRPNQHAYWTSRGFSDGEATDRVRMRQSTNSLEAFVRRANGDTKLGAAAHADRQERWLTSLKASGLYKGYSDISGALFENLQSFHPDLQFGNNEIVLKLIDRSVKIDCVHRKKKLVIEFYGDYWHGNPLKYKAESLIAGQPASHKWEKDASRIAAIQQAGYKVLIIWEADYRADPVAVAERCLDFLEQRELALSA